MALTSYKVDDKVTALSRSGRHGDKMRKAIITRIQPNGYYDVVFESGPIDYGTAHFSNIKPRK